MLCFEQNLLPTMRTASCRPYSSMLRLSVEISPDISGHQRMEDGLGFFGGIRIQKTDLWLEVEPGISAHSCQRGDVL